MAVLAHISYAVIFALSAVGIYPGVSVYYTPVARTSSLFADKFCGPGTSLIFYIQPGSVLSRPFTAKDTHSPRGELLVVYSDARGSVRDFDLARHTSAVLGFNAPSFTYGTDLILPVRANADLREELLLGVDVAEGEEDMEALRVIETFDDISVPQVRVLFLTYTLCGNGVFSF